MRILTARKTGCVTMTNTRTDAVPNGRAPFFVFSGMVFVVSVAATIYFSRSMSGGMENASGPVRSFRTFQIPAIQTRSKIDLPMKG